jgi:hypothetical protein
MQTDFQKIPHFDTKNRISTEAAILRQAPLDWFDKLTTGALGTGSAGGHFKPISVKYCQTAGLLVQKP